MNASQPTQLTFIDAATLSVPEKAAWNYSYQEVKIRIPEILDRHHTEIEQALVRLKEQAPTEQAKNFFGRLLPKKQKDALGLSFEIHSMATELVKKNTLLAFYLRYLEEKKLYLALGFRSFKDYAVSYFDELEYSYLTRLKRIAYMSSEEIETLEPLGTTKMMMIAQLKPDVRKDILKKEFAVQDNEFKKVIDMSTRELGRVVQKQKNPNLEDNLIKGLPAALLHNARGLQENLNRYERSELERVQQRLRELIRQIDEHLEPRR